ncbi:hypothetical protein B0T18DRAFT_492147 [Schizothecium vesticola]|uniref:Uncharacterized protein n=1 Tax=Schizothecium vesticola TaxID=314040 RepID=A0AA40EGW1_9PEZI|nr:hypothetical protein B0T18DRAFT_492147 [Schizothecium vesticola]
MANYHEILVWAEATSCPQAALSLAPGSSNLLGQVIWRHEGATAGLHVPSPPWQHSARKPFDRFLLGPQETAQACYAKQRWFLFLTMAVDGCGYLLRRRRRTSPPAAASSSRPALPHSSPSLSCVLPAASECVQRRVAEPAKKYDPLGVISRAVWCDRPLFLALAP